jgi:hypothetical protein
MIAVPTRSEVEQYSVRGEVHLDGIPLISDDEAVCRVRVIDSGSGAYWSRGDVDVHVLDAKQRGFSGGFLDDLLPEASLARVLRERREARRRLQSGGVHTTASGLTLLARPTQLFVPTRQ